jgi:modified peptide precursor CbpA
MRKACAQPEPFSIVFLLFPEEWIMTQNIQPQAPAQTDTNDIAAKTQAVAPTIAVRKSCNPDGIGLSHYVLMDKKAAK